MCVLRIILLAVQPNAELIHRELSHHIAQRETSDVGELQFQYSAYLETSNPFLNHTVSFRARKMLDRMDGHDFGQRPLPERQTPGIRHHLHVRQDPHVAMQIPNPRPSATANFQVDSFDRRRQHLQTVAEMATIRASPNPSIRPSAKNHVEKPFWTSPTRNPYSTHLANLRFSSSIMWY